MIMLVAAAATTASLTENPWVVLSGVAASTLLIVTGIYRYIVKPLRESLERQRLRDADWYGEPARPGVPARKGMMERVMTIEAEVTPNSGGSLKDVAHRTEVAVRTLELNLSSVNSKVDDHLAETRQQRDDWYAWRNRTDLAVAEKNALDAKSVSHAAATQEVAVALTARTLSDTRTALDVKNALDAQVVQEAADDRAARDHS